MANRIASGALLLDFETASPYNTVMLDHSAVLACLRSVHAWILIFTLHFEPALQQDMLSFTDGPMNVCAGGIYKEYNRWAD